MKTVKEWVKEKQAVKQAKIRQEFLPEAQEIVEKAQSPVGHFVVVITAVIIVSFIAWSIVGKMDEVVTARGKVVTVSGIQSVQALNTGIVEKIFVKEGEYVQTGQIIVLADTSANTIVLKNLEESLELLKMENELLTGLLEGKEMSAVVSDEDNSRKVQIRNYVFSMQEGYISKREELNDAIKQAELQITIEEMNLEKVGKEISFLENMETVIRDRIIDVDTNKWNSEKIEISIEYKEEELGNYQKLYELGAVSKAVVEQAEFELEQLKTDYKIQQALEISANYDESIQLEEIARQLQVRRSDYESQKEVVVLARQRYRQELDKIGMLETEYKSEIIGRIVQNEETIRNMESDSEIQIINTERQKILAPVNGFIQSLDVGTEGNVLTAAQTVAIIVPDGEQMIVELMVLNRDVGNIYVGQSVAMKLDAYNFQEYGKLDGTIISISPDAISDAQKGWVYQAKVAIDDKKFRQKNPNIEVEIGLECTAEVIVGERRIIDFFLEPIIEHFDGSLKVR